VGDLDLDGRDEVRLSTEGQTVVIKLDEGGGVGSWDLRAARHGLTSVLRRRPEAYHETLRRHEREVAERVAAKAAGTAAPAAAAPAPAGAAETDPSGDVDAHGDADAPASIHDMVQVKEEGLAARLVYDDYERRSGLIRVLPAEATADTWGAGGHDDAGDFVDGAFVIERLDRDGVRLSRDGRVIVAGRPLPVRAESEIRVGGGRLDPTLEQRVSLENRGDRLIEARVGIEWALTMLGGGGNPEAWWEPGPGAARGAHDGAGSAAAVDGLAQGNDWLGVALATSVNPPGDAWYAPIETVSNSEAGFERVYQGSALLLSWPVRLGPGERWAATIRHAATISEDRARSEAGTSVARA
jgi:alpha-amylase